MDGLSIMDLEQTVETLSNHDQETSPEPAEVVIRTIGKKKYKLKRNPAPKRKGVSLKNQNKDSNA